MYPDIADDTSARPLDFDRVRDELVVGSVYAPSFYLKEDLGDHIAMLESEFIGQSRLKLVHAVLNVLLRRDIATETVYGHLRTLWREHGDILLDALDSRWLISTCDSICDHAPDPAEAQSAALLSLFMNTVKLAETERLMSSPGESVPGRIKGACHSSTG